MNKWHKKLNILGFSDIYGRHKTWIIFLSFLCLIALLTGILSSIKFYNGVLPVSFSNIAFINYLKDKTNFVMMFISNFFATGLFVFVVVVCFVNIYCRFFGVLFFMYFVYARILTLISMMLIYGVLNTLIIVLCMLAFAFCYIVLFLFLTSNCLDICSAGGGYFRNCFNRNFFTLNFLVVFGVCVFFESIVIGILKNFVVILIY